METYISLDDERYDLNDPETLGGYNDQTEIAEGDGQE